MTIQQEKCEGRDFYEAPEVEIIELTAEGVLDITSYPQWGPENI